jgi:K+-sensing histidine kinase KdpD
MCAVGKQASSSLRNSLLLRRILRYLIDFKNTKNIISMYTWINRATCVNIVMEQVPSWPLKLGPIGCPETSVKITTIRCVISQQSKFLTTATVRITVTMRRVRVTIVYVKKKQILHILSVYLILVIQHTKACAVLSYVACLALPYFFTLSYKRHGFREKAIEYKMCVSIFSTTFASNISHSKKNSARHCHKCTYVFM